MGQDIQGWTKKNLWKIGCLSQILLGPFLNTLTQMFSSSGKRTEDNAFGPISCVRMYLPVGELKSLYEVHMKSICKRKTRVLTFFCFRFPNSLTWIFPNIFLWMFLKLWFYFRWFARFGTLCTIWKTWKSPMDECYL